MTATVETIRSHFPALARRSGESAVAYFDGPGGTQVPRAVVDAMSDYLLHHNANTHWAFPSSQETDAALYHARETCATFLNAAAEDVSFGANMTTLTFHLSRALGRSLHADDEIVVTELDHHANIDPWRALETERGVRIRNVPLVPETGQLDMARLESAVNSRTRLVAVGAASNALGTVNDVRRVVEIARDVGARVFVDGVHYAPHELPDVVELGCDFFACSAYKFYGPHVGILFARSDIARTIDFPRLQPAPSRPPERAETGTLNHEGIVGAAAAIDWLAGLGAAGALRERLASAYADLHARGDSLVRRMWTGLQDIPRVTVYGPKPGVRRTPTISFAVEEVASETVARALAAEGVFVSHGDFYAQTVVQRLGHGRDGLVRAGCACYTTPEEVDRLIDGVRRMASA